MTEKNNIKIQLYWNTLLQAPTQVISFIISIYVASILTPNDYGILTITMMIIGYANLITNFGLNEAIVQKNITDKKIIGSIFTLDFSISICLFIIFITISQFVAEYFNSPESQNVIRVASAVFLITAFQGIAEALLKRDMNFKTLSLLNATKAISSSILTLSLALLHYEYWALIFGQIVPLFVFTIILCLKARWMPFFTYKHTKMRAVYHFGVWNFIKSQIQFVMQHLDKFIIGRYLGPASLGIYDKAISISMVPLSTITMNINAVMFSSFSRNKTDKTRLKNNFIKSVTLISLINIPIYTGLIIIAPYFVTIFLGQQWIKMIDPFQIILAASIIKSFGGISSSLNVGVGNYKSNTLRLLMSAGIFLISALLLLTYGVIGIAVSYLISAAFETFFILRLSLGITNIAWSEIFKAIMPSAVGSSILYLTIKPLSVVYLNDYTISNLLFIIISGILVYFLYVMVFSGGTAKEFYKIIIKDMITRIHKSM